MKSYRLTPFHYNYDYKIFHCILHNNIKRKVYILSFLLHKTTEASQYNLRKNLHFRYNAHCSEPTNLALLTYSKENHFYYV